MFEMLLVSSVVIKLTLLIWLKNLDKSESKRYFCNSRIQNNSTIYTSKYFVLFDLILYVPSTIFQL